MNITLEHIKVLEQQRNSALNEVVNLRAEIALLREELRLANIQASDTSMDLDKRKPEDDK